MPQRVRQEITEDLADPNRVDVQDGKPRSHSGLESHLHGGGPRPEPVRRVVYQTLGRHGFAVQAQRSRLGRRQRQQVIEEPRHHLGLLEHSLQAGLIRCVDAVEHALGVPPDHGERGAQLVGDVGQEVPPVLLALSQSLHHLVERPGQPADVAGPSLLHAHVVVAAGHPLGRFHHLAHRLRHPPHGASGGDERHQQAHREDGDERRESPVAVQSEAVREHHHRQRVGGDGEPEEDRHRDRDAPKEAAAHSPPRPAPRRREGLTLRPPRRPKAWAAAVPPPRRAERASVRVRHRRTDSPRRAP